MFTLSLFHARITHILSLTLDSLLIPSTFAFAFTIIYPQSPRPSSRFRANSCVVLVTALLFLILVEGVYLTFAFA